MDDIPFLLEPNLSQPVVNQCLSQGAFGKR